MLSQQLPKFSYFKASINCYTFKVPKIKKWVENQCKGLKILNLFGGPTRLLGCIEIWNDIDPSMNAELQLDAIQCLNLMIDRKEKFDVVILDPPYSYRKSMEYYHGNLNSRFKRCLDLIPEILTFNGKVICFGYHASQMGKLRGFYVDEVLVVDHSGAMHSTLACVEKRIGSN